MTLSRWAYAATGVVILVLVACVVYETWYNLHGAGVLGCADSIGEIPHADKDFAGIKAEGPFTYVYKMVPHHVLYMFAGRISEDHFREFCAADEGWVIESLCLAGYVDSFDDFHVDVSHIPLAKQLVEEPLQDGRGNCNEKYNNDFYAYREVAPDIKGGTGIRMRVYFRKEERRFFAYVMRRYRKGDCDYDD